MSRLLFFVILAFILGYWWSSRRQRNRSSAEQPGGKPAPAPAPAAPLMLQCQVCGAHVPAGEARHSPKGPCCSEACAKKAWS